MLQSGQESTSPHWTHWTNDEYPRRLRSRIDCSFLRTRSRRRCSSSSLMTRRATVSDVWVFGGSYPLGTRMSTTRTGGSIPPPTRSGSESRRYLPLAAFDHDSRLGVAL